MFNLSDDPQYQFSLENTELPEEDVAKIEAVGSLIASALPFTSSIPDMLAFLLRGKHFGEWTVDAFGERHWKIDQEPRLHSVAGLKVRYLGDDPTLRETCSELNRLIKSELEA